MSDWCEIAFQTPFRLRNSVELRRDTVVVRPSTSLVPVSMQASRAGEQGEVAAVDEVQTGRLDPPAEVSGRLPIPLPRDVAPPGAVVAARSHVDGLVVVPPGVLHGFGVAAEDRLQRRVELVGRLLRGPGAVGSIAGGEVAGGAGGGAPHDQQGDGEKCDDVGESHGRVS